MRSGLIGSCGERHAEGRQRVGDRVHHRGRGADGAALAHALVATGAGAGRLDVAVLDGRDLDRRRHEVVHERGGERVAVLVDGEVLVERVPDALRDAARDLPLDDVGVDHRAAVLAHDVAEELHLAGVDVDLAGADVGGVHPDRAGGGGVARRRLQARRRAGGQRPQVRCRRCGRSPRATRPWWVCLARWPGCRPARCPRPRPRACGRRWRRCARAGWPRSRCTAPAIIDPLRLPPVPAPNPVTAVSPWIVWTSSMRTPRASAVSCTAAVSRLFPLEPPARYTLTTPDGSTRIVAASVPKAP